MKTLVIDIGGTNIKMLATGQEMERKFPSGPRMTALQMVENVKRATVDWEYDGVSIGYPGPVIHDKLALEPRNLAPGWVDFDFAAAFGKPVKLINDAAMQALGSYEGGRMLFLGLGTGLGSALIVDGVIAPLELAHLPYRKCRTFEDYVGLRGLLRLGKKKWTKAVADVAARLQAAMVADSVVLGGGNAKKLKRLPTGARLGLNTNAFVGGFRLWDPHARHHLDTAAR
jgi:polyphosphate glucokinase